MRVAGGLFVAVLGGCNLLTDYDTDFLPDPVDAAVGLDAAELPDAAELDGGGLDPAPCELVFAPTLNDASAPRGSFPAVAQFGEQVAVAYVGRIDPDDGWSRLQVRLGSCEALDGETVILEAEGAATNPVSQPDAAWNPVAQALGVAWAQGEENHFAKWRTLRRGDGGLELGSPRFLDPAYEAGTYDLRWPRVTVTDGEWVVLLPDTVAASRTATVHRFAGDPWPPNLDTLTLRWPGALEDYLAAGVADVAGRSATSEYHIAMGVGAVRALESAHVLVADGMVRGSDPLLAGVLGARIAAIDDVLPQVWLADEATPAALVALDEDGALELLYPDKSTTPLPVDGATSVTAYDAIAMGSLLVVTWAETVDEGVTEVRVGVADLRDGEIAWQSGSKTIATSSEGGVHGLSATSLVEGGRIAVSWAEPDQGGFDRVRVACVVCTPP